MTQAQDGGLPAAAAALAETPGPERALRLEHDGTVCWVKRPAARGAFLHWTRGDPARLLDHETRAIRQMHAAGLPVPKVLHAAHGLLVISDVGTPLDRLWAGADAQRREALAAQAIDGLAALHRAGAAHGSPHLRNLALAEDRLAFFDLEQATPDGAGVAQMQHDLGVLLYSMFGLGTRAATVADALARYRAGMGEAVPLALARRVRRRAWLRPLIRALRVIDDRRRPDRPHRIYAALLQMSALMDGYR